jgi:16S rRNA (uracil1498-N3)-methyltransferase
MAAKWRASRSEPRRAEARPATAAHVFVDDLTSPALRPDDRHHLARVLRIRAGEPVTASDGAGRWRLCRFGPALEPDGDIVVVPRPDPPITIAFAVPKGDRPERVVQQLTEAGVDRIVPFMAEHSVVRWDAERADRHVARFRVIAREAAMQSRRIWLAEVAALATFAEVAAMPGAALADMDGDAPALTHPTVLVGPEGGWSPAERTAGPPAVSLGPHVLRAETAAVAAGVLLAALRGRLVTPGGATNTERGIVGHTR